MRVALTALVVCALPALAESVSVSVAPGTRCVTEDSLREQLARAGLTLVDSGGLDVDVSANAEGVRLRARRVQDARLLMRTVPLRRGCAGLEQALVTLIREWALPPSLVTEPRPQSTRRDGGDVGPAAVALTVDSAPDGGWFPAGGAPQPGGNAPGRNADGTPLSSSAAGPTPPKSNVSAALRVEGRSDSPMGGGNTARAGEGAASPSGGSTESASGAPRSAGRSGSPTGGGSAARAGEGAASPSGGSAEVTAGAPGASAAGEGAARASPSGGSAEVTAGAPGASAAGEGAARASPSGGRTEAARGAPGASAGGEGAAQASPSAGSAQASGAPGGRAGGEGALRASLSGGSTEAASGAPGARAGAGASSSAEARARAGSSSTGGASVDARSAAGTTAPLDATGGGPTPGAGLDGAAAPPGAPNSSSGVTNTGAPPAPEESWEVRVAFLGGVSSLVSAPVTPAGAVLVDLGRRSLGASLDLAVDGNATLVAAPGQLTFNTQSLTLAARWRFAWQRLALDLGLGARGFRLSVTPSGFTTNTTQALLAVGPIFLATVWVRLVGPLQLVLRGSTALRLPADELLILNGPTFTLGVLQVSGVAGLSVAWP